MLFKPGVNGHPLSAYCAIQLAQSCNAMSQHTLTFQFQLSLNKLLSCEVQSFLFVVRVVEIWLTVDFCKSAS